MFEEKPKPPPADVCYLGAHCSHAVLTDKIGVYRCPFGGMAFCFKKLPSQKEDKKKG